MENIDQFKTLNKITWCLGCGNFGILTALKNAFLELGLNPYDILIVYGIGCHGHMANYLKTYGFEGLHGRALPLATGAKISNHKLNVIVVAGDGDQLGEGGNHLIHSSRRNSDITCLIHNNQIYGLTVGQASPTSEKNFKTKTTPQGVIESPINPLSLSLVGGASFVARGFGGDVKHLTKMIVEAIRHKGFSVVDILQPCVTFNYLNTYQWFYQKVYKLDESNYNFQDKLSALEKTLEWGEKIPLGVFYKEERSTFEGQLSQIKTTPLVQQPIENIKIQELLKEFR